MNKYITDMKKILSTILILFLAASTYAQSDSIGVYAILNSTAQRVEILKYNQTKISSGIGKGKAKLKFSGASSPNRFTGSATFRLYFGVPSPYDMANYFMFAPPYSAKDFSVGKFDVKKGSRYLTTVKASIFGSTSIGAAKSDEVAVTTKQIRKDVYEITVSAPAGEYCIMPVVYGAGGYAGVFDFSIE